MYGSDTSASASGMRVVSSRTAGRPSRVARPERVGELLSLLVQQHGAVGAGGLGNRIPLHVCRPGTAVRVVLQRIEVTRLRAELECDLRHLTGRAGMVGGQLPALLGLLEAAASGGQHDGTGLHLVIPDPCSPAVLGPLQIGKRALR